MDGNLHYGCYVEIDNIFSDGFDFIAQFSNFIYSTGGVSCEHMSGEAFSIEEFIERASKAVGMVGTYMPFENFRHPILLKNNVIFIIQTIDYNSSSSINISILNRSPKDCTKELLTNYIDFISLFLGSFNVKHACISYDDERKFRCNKFYNGKFNRIYWYNLIRKDTFNTIGLEKIEEKLPTFHENFILNEKDNFIEIYCKKDILESSDFTRIKLLKANT